MRRGLPLFERGACLIILPQRFKGGGGGRGEGGGGAVIQREMVSIFRH